MQKMMKKSYERATRAPQVVIAGIVAVWIVVNILLVVKVVDERKRPRNLRKVPAQQPRSQYSKEHKDVDQVFRLSKIKNLEIFFGCFGIHSAKHA